MSETISTDEYNELIKEPAPSKYRNRRVKADGYTFDSVAELRRYCELKLMQAAGEIANLQVHPRFDLSVNSSGEWHKICTYVADFSYHGENGYIVEDVKGVRTQAYRIKKRLLQVLHLIDIVEIEA